MSDTDTLLVRRAQTGDRAAFEELVRRTSRLVYARVYLETGKADRAEDLVQDTFLTAFRKLSQLDRPEGFRPWLLAIAHSCMIDAARREKRLKRAPPTGDAVPIAEVEGDGPTPEQAALREERRQQVLSYVRALPEDYRLPIMLRYIGEADAASIGTQLGLTNGSLRGLLHRGLKLLRERIPADLRIDG